MRGREKGKGTEGGHHGQRDSRLATSDRDRRRKSPKPSRPRITEPPPWFETNPTRAKSGFDGISAIL